MNSDIEIIKGRLTLLFKRRPKTRYWLMLTNDTYDQTYNLFFNSQRANERLQSVPLHKSAHYDLADLEKLLKALRQDIKLTIEFVGFTGIHGYNANDIVIDADRFIPLQEIRNVSFKNTEKL